MYFGDKLECFSNLLKLGQLFYVGEGSRSSTCVVSFLTLKYWTRPAIFVSDKHSSLSREKVLQHLTLADWKSFSRKMSLSKWASYKTFSTVLKLNKLDRLSPTLFFPVRLIFEHKFEAMLRVPDDAYLMIWALHLSFRVNWKILPRVNTLAYFGFASEMKKKSFAFWHQV